MKLKNTCLLIFISAMILFLGACNDCSKVDCPENRVVVDFLFKKDGQTFPIGDTVIIELDELFDQQFISRTITLINIQDSIICVSLHENATTLMRVNDLAAGSFDVRTKIADETACCTIFGLDAVLENGLVLCDDGCMEVLTIDLE